MDGDQLEAFRKRAEELKGEIRPRITGSGWFDLNGGAEGIEIDGEFVAEDLRIIASAREQLLSEFKFSED